MKRRMITTMLIIALATTATACSDTTQTAEERRQEIQSQKIQSYKEAWAGIHPQQNPVYIPFELSEEDYNTALGGRFYRNYLACLKDKGYISASEKIFLYTAIYEEGYSGKELFKHLNIYPDITIKYYKPRTIEEFKSGVPATVVRTEHIGYDEERFSKSYVEYRG